MHNLHKQLSVYQHTIFTKRMLIYQCIIFTDRMSMYQCIMFTNRISLYDAQTPLARYQYISAQCTLIGFQFIIKLRVKIHLDSNLFFQKISFICQSNNTQNSSESKSIDHNSITESIHSIMHQMIFYNKINLTNKYQALYS